jgi:hypothetical protein
VPGAYKSSSTSPTKIQDKTTLKSEKMNYLRHYGKGAKMWYNFKEIKEGFVETFQKDLTGSECFMWLSKWELSSLPGIVPVSAYCVCLFLFFLFRQDLIM